MRYFLITLLFISSCGQPPIRPINPYDRPHDKKVQIDKAFDEYMEDFEDDWGLDVTDLTIKFTTVEQDPKTPTVILGVCYLKSDTTPRIIIDPGTWANMSDTKRKLLIYHEMGHCVLFRKHVEGTNTSIMNPMLMSSAVFENDPRFFISELFDDKQYGSWDLNLTHDHNHGE